MFNKFTDKLANDRKFNRGFLVGSMILEAVCTVGVLVAEYFAGVNAGVNAVVVTEEEGDTDE